MLRRCCCAKGKKAGCRRAGAAYLVPMQRVESFWSKIPMSTGINTLPFPTSAVLFSPFVPFNCSTVVPFFTPAAAIFAASHAQLWSETCTCNHSGYYCYIMSESSKGGVAKSLEPFVCGGAAATFASIVIHPIDLAKVRRTNLVRILAISDRREK